LYSTDIKVLYHYTDEDSASDIEDSGVIYKSSGRGDASFGRGVYLTSIGMDTPAEDLAENNWDDATLPDDMIDQGRTDCAVKIRIKRRKVSKVMSVKNSGRDIYLYKGNLRLNSRDVIRWRIVYRK